MTPARKDDRSTERSAAGPVAAGDPPPPAVAEASSGAVPPTPPPAGEAAGSDEARDEAVEAAGPVAGQGSPAHPPGTPDPTPPAGEAPAQDAADETQVEHDLDALLADTKRERDEYLELAQRTKADFENYRKRMTGEIQLAAARGRAELAHELIGAVDNLERALLAAGIEPDRADPPSEGDSAPDAFVHGVLLVLRSLREALERNGIEALDPKGERFDPAWHEALATQPGAGAEPGTVLDVVQKGYRLQDQLIRPARVTVSQ